MPAPLRPPSHRSWKRTPQTDMSWYEQWFDADEYDLVYQDRDENEARSLIDLIEAKTSPGPGSTVLDIGCGRGRHAVDFAVRGHVVTGLDLSPRSLEAAQERAAEADVEVSFVRGDMRTAIGGQFDLVVNLFTAFGYFEDDSGHQQAVDAMAASMTPDAWLVQDFLNPAFLRDSLVSSDVRHVGDSEIRQARRIENGRIRKRIEFLKGRSTHSFEESVALLELADFERFYAAAGLQLESVVGDYAGGPHGPSSPRTILFSRRTG
ncbi:MAG: SAM-dependent methyltransferase [Rhodothermales bacterium]|jgi:SAM-dependent methyltransferase